MSRAAPLALVLLLLAFALVPVAAALQQDPASYPDGITGVSNTPLMADKEFSVDVTTDGPAESVVVTVCRFRSLTAEGPDVCFMNLAAEDAGDAAAFTADTGAVDHPAWKDGWIVGYKVTVTSAAGEAHAPDRLAQNGEPDYYRIRVGSAQEEPVEGTAVVEDTPVSSDGDGAAPAAAATPSNDAPLPPSVVLIALGLGLAARRRR